METKNKLLLLSVCFGLILKSTSLFSQTAEQKTKTFLAASMEKEHIPGLAYAVIEKGRIKTIGVMGKADLAWNQPVTMQTPFQTASVSKVFCGVLLARLFDAEVLKPEQTLKELIDSIPSEWNKITVLQLATHQSGIKIAEFIKAKSSSEAIELAKKQTFEFQPGEKSSYVSSDFWILQYLIEKKTGMSYFEALKKYVLTPLKMTNTYVNNWQDGMAKMSDVIPGEATVYHYDYSQKLYRKGDFPFVSSGYAAGGIYTSISDFSKLAIALDGKVFLSKKSYDLLVKAKPFNNGTLGHYGLGLIVRDHEGHKLVEHSGGPALADFSRFEDKGLTFIVLTNQRGFYPYLSKSAATFYIPGLKMQEVPKNY